MFCTSSPRLYRTILPPRNPSFSLEALRRSNRSRLSLETNLSNTLIKLTRYIPFKLFSTTPQAISRPAKKTWRLMIAGIHRFIYNKSINRLLTTFPNDTWKSADRISFWWTLLQKFDTKLRIADFCCPKAWLIFWKGCRRLGFDKSCRNID